jgi:hypothetical protein
VRLCEYLFVAFFLFGDFPASEFYLRTFRNTASSIFIGDVSRENNRDQIARVFIQVTVIPRRLNFMCRRFGHSVSSIFIGGLSSENNRYQIARVFIQVKVIPRLLNFMCGHFGTPCLFHLHRWRNQKE